MTATPAQLPFMGLAESVEYRRAEAALECAAKRGRYERAFLTAFYQGGKSPAEAEAIARKAAA